MVKRSVATQFCPIKGSRSCAVRSPGEKLIAPAPALFQRTCSLDSWAANAAAEAFTERWCFWSWCWFFFVPGVLGVGGVETMAWIAFSAFDWRVLGCLRKRGWGLT